MIRFFRSSFLVQYLAVLAMAVALWMPAFMKAPAATPPADNEPLYSLLYAPVSGFPGLSVFVAFFFMLASGYMLNAILSLYLLIPRISTYGLLFWVIVAGSFPAAMSLQPLWPALLMLLLALNLAFSMYDQQSINYKLFNFGALVAFSGMFHGGAWLFLLWVLAVLFVLRVNKMREWLIPLLGFFAMLIYLSIFWFLQNKLATNLGHFLLAFVEGLSLPKTPAVMQLVIFGFLTLLFFNALSFNYSLQADRNIAVRKRKAMLNAFAFVALAVFFLRNATPESNMLLMVPLSAHLAIWAGGLNRTARPSAIVWIYFLLALTNNILFFAHNA